MDALNWDYLDNGNTGYTTDDIYALPDGERAEIIDGRWYDMAAPTSQHQKISMKVSYEFEHYIREKGGDCQVYPAPFAVFLNKDNKTYVEPDISVICDPDKIDERGCNGAPDLVVEIVSPATKTRDLGIKLFKYRTAGVREYWVVNPIIEVTTVYLFSLTDEEAEIVDQIPFDEPVTSHIYPDFSITLAELLK